MYIISVYLREEPIMTKEELQTRIDKTTEKIEKINKRIAKLFYSQRK